MGTETPAGQGAASAGSRDEPPWVVAGDGRRSQDELRRRAACGAWGFRAAGVGAGGTVAVLLRNGFAGLEAAMAAGLAGAVAVPLDPDMAAEPLGAVLRECGARAAVAHPDVLARLAEALPPGLLCLTADPRADRPVTDGRDWDGFVAAHPPLDRAAAAPPSTLIYTSGSTGRPKGVRRDAAPAGPPSPRAVAVYGLDTPGRATVLITGPLHHSVPNALARTALAAGADLVLPPSFAPEELLALAARHRVTHMHVVPSLMARWLQLPAAVRARHDLSALRHVVHGAAHCPPALKRAAIAWWGPVVHEYYGSTETGLLTLHDSAEALARPGTVGRALPGIALHVLDPAGRPLPPGESGRVYAGSATLHRFTYLGRDAERAAIGFGDLVTAGDIGTLDRDGYLYLQDRARDVVELDGRPVYPSRLEAMALAAPGVADAAAFGLAGPDGRVGLCLCVEPVAGGAVDTAALRARVETELPLLEGRLRVESVTVLPRQDTGKIFKDQLRAAFATPGAGRT